MRKIAFLVSSLIFLLVGCGTNKTNEDKNSILDVPQTEITDAAPVVTDIASDGDADAKETSKEENDDLSGEDYNIDVKALADELMNNITFSDEMIEGMDIVVTRQYGIEEDDYVSQASYFSMAVTTEEIAVIECSSNEAALEMKKIMSQRVESQKDVFEDYAPDEVKRLNNAVIEVLGKYAIFCVSDDPAKVKEIVNNYKSM